MFIFIFLLFVGVRLKQRKQSAKQEGWAIKIEVGAYLSTSVCPSKFWHCPLFILNTVADRKTRLIFFSERTLPLLPNSSQLQSHYADPLRGSR